MALKFRHNLCAESATGKHSCKMLQTRSPTTGAIPNVEILSLEILGGEFEGSGSV